MFSDGFGKGAGAPNPHWEAKSALEATGIEVLDLTGSNPTACGIAYPDGISALLDRPEALRYRPDPQGLLSAREAVAAYYGARGRKVAPEDLLLTASTSEAYSFLFKLLCNPGDEVLIPSPTYPLFDALAELEHVGLVRYPLKLEGPEARWRTDFRFLRSMVSTRTKALILVNPNNPTGHLADAGELRAYVDLAAEYGFALIVDEVFRDYILGERPFLPLQSSGPLVFTLNGLSKVLGLPQMKLGWIHIGGAREAAQAARGHLEWIADAFLSVNTPVQAAAGDLLRLDGPIQAAILERVRGNLAAAESLFRGGRSRILKPEAGWYLVLNLDAERDDEALAMAVLEKARVYAYPGYLFGFEEGCQLVVSLLGPGAEFREGLRRIRAVMETLSESGPAQGALHG